MCLLRIINLDGSNSIKYPEFVVFVRDPNHRNVSTKFISGIRKAGLTPSDICRTILNAANHHHHLSGGAEKGNNWSSQSKRRSTKDHESLGSNSNSRSCSPSSRTAAAAAAAARDRAEYYCKSTTGGVIIELLLFLSHFFPNSMGFSRLVSLSNFIYSTVHITVEGEKMGNRAIIRIRDFENQLHRIGLNMGKDELRRLCYRFDENEDGLLTVDRIIEFVELETLSQRSAAPLDNIDEVNTIIARIARIIPQRGGLYRNLSLSLERCDEYQDGKLSCCY